ncbi:hypothetical protein HYX18_03125 [Candidatus Woesearchaeota archaeon]|nr:hypothetical protein [Candidatus Woesearchaeota archaeon]
MKNRDIKDKKSKQKLLWAFFIIFIMISSSAAFVYNFFVTNNTTNNKTKTEYKGYKFNLNENGGWQTNYKGYNIEFYYLPNELDDINIDSIKLNENKIYLAYNASEVHQSILFNIQRISYILLLNDKIGTPSCIEEKNCPDIPIVECKGSNKVIYFNKVDSNFDKDKVLISEDNCYIISSDDTGINKVTDKLIYKIIGLA